MSWHPTTLLRKSCSRRNWIIQFLRVCNWGDTTAPYCTVLIKVRGRFILVYFGQRCLCHRHHEIDYYKTAVSQYDAIKLMMDRHHLKSIASCSANIITLSIIESFMASWRWEGGVDRDVCSRKSFPRVPAYLRIIPMWSIIVASGSGGAGGLPASSRDCSCTGMITSIFAAKHWIWNCCWNSLPCPETECISNAPNKRQAWMQSKDSSFFLVGAFSRPVYISKDCVKRWMWLMLHLCH